MSRRSHSFWQKSTFWQKNKFKFSGLVLILPFWFLYQSMNPVFPPALPKATVGPFEVTVSPLTEDGAYLHHGEWVKDYYLQLCVGCVEKIRQGFLVVSKQAPDFQQLSQGHSSVLHGTVHGLHVHASTPEKLQGGEKLWLLLEDWQGKRYQHSWDL